MIARYIRYLAIIPTKLLETFEDSKDCFVCVFSNYELVLFDSKFVFSSLTLSVAIVNQSHRGVVYLFKFQEDVACKSKFLMDLD